MKSKISYNNTCILQWSDDSNSNKSKVIDNIIIIIILY